MTRPYLDRAGPWLIAHRGGSSLFPENTFLAFDRAQALGADALETDVHLSRDGVVFVFHDDDTRRLTGEAGTLEERTSAEIVALDAAFGFTRDGGRSFPYRGLGVRIPTLRDAFLRYPATRFSIDAKSDEPALAEALVSVVSASGATERVCLGSFHDAQAERIGKLLPEVARHFPQEAATCHVLSAKSGASPKGCPRDYDVASLPHRLGDQVIVDRAVVEHFHALFVPVHVFTVDEESDMRELLRLGVDGIVSDRPDLLARVLGRS